MSTLSKLRRLVLRQDVSVREASRRLGISRNTVTKWLKGGQMAEPLYPQRVSGPSLMATIGLRRHEMGELRDRASAQARMKAAIIDHLLQVLPEDYSSEDIEARADTVYPRLFIRDFAEQA